MKFFSRVRNYFSQFTNDAKDLTTKIVSHYDEDESTEHLQVDVTKPVSQHSKEEKTHMHFARTFWITWAVVVGGLYFAMEALPLLILFLASYIIAIALEGPIRFFYRFLRNRWWAIFFCYFFFILFLLSLLLIIPFVLNQVAALLQLFITQMNEALLIIEVEGWKYFIETSVLIPSFLTWYLLPLADDPLVVENLKIALQDMLGIWNEFVSGLTDNALSLIGQVFWSSVSIWWQVSLVIVLSIFFSLNQHELFAFVVRLFGKKADVAQARMVVLYDKLQLWLKGQLFLMLYIGVVSFLWLLILRLAGIDIPQIWLLALIAWVTEFIPYIWPALGGIPAILVAFVAHGRVGALLVFVLFLFVQWTENNIVVPVVMNKVLGIRSIIIFVTMVLAAWIFGFIGVLLAVPLSVIVTILFDKHYK